VISKSPRILHVRTFAVSSLLCSIGAFSSIVWNLPLGAACVFAGGATVVVQSFFARK
jgi:hypothetical protein